MPVNEIKRLLPRHYAILDLVLLGHGPGEVAETLGITSVSAGMVINSPLFQDELARRRATQSKQTDAVAFDAKLRAKQMLGHLSVRAVEVHEELLISQDESIRQRSASKILDEVFRDDTPKGANGQALPKGVVMMTTEALALLATALRESGLSSRKTEFIESTGNAQNSSASNGQEIVSGAPLIPPMDQASLSLSTNGETLEASAV